MSSTEWNMKKFMKGASILTLAAIFVKILGAVYRVPFQNMVGDQGFYIYQQVYPFIGIFIVWTSYGFAVAVSKLLAESKKPGESRAIKRIAFWYLSVISIVLFMILMIFAPFFAAAMGDDQLASLLRAGAYIVLVMPALAVLKGSFQSEGQMLPVAVSSVVEQAFRVAVILVGTFMAMRVGASLYTAGEIAMWGAVVGEAAGVIMLGLYLKRTVVEPILPINRWQVVKDLTTISISVSVSSLILLFFQLVDSFTVYNALLTQGIISTEAMELKGIYDRGQPLVQMGVLISTTLALAIVPLIAYQTEKKGGRGAEPFIQLTYRTAFLFGWAAAFGLALVLPYVNEMLFETRSGSTTLIVFALQIFWLSLILPLTAMLQGIGKVKVPAFFLGLGLAVKWGINTPMVAKFGVLGASIAGNIGFLLITILLFIYVKQTWKFALAPTRFYGWIIGATLAMFGVVFPWMYIAEHFIFNQLSSRWLATWTGLTSVAIGGVVFLIVIMKNRLMAPKEWYLLPFGKYLAAIQLRLTSRR